MTLKYTLGWALLAGSRVLARPALVDRGQNFSNYIIQVDQLPVYLQTDLLTAHTPIEPITSNVSGSNDIHIQCDDPSFDSDLDISDCGAANANFLSDSTRYLFTERHSDSQGKVFPLPYRSMGGDASCYVQPVLMEGTDSSWATLDEVRNAAAMIRGTCLSGGKLRGGIATGIGMVKTPPPPLVERPWQTWGPGIV